MPDITAPDRLPPAPIHHDEPGTNGRGPDRLPPAPRHRIDNRDGDNGHPQDEKIRIGIHNTTEEAAKSAREIAEEQKNEILRRPPGWNPILWAQRIGMRWVESGWVSIQKDRIMDVMRRNNTTLLTGDMACGAAVSADVRQRHEEKQQAVVERFRTRSEEDLANRGELKRTLDQPEHQAMRNLIINDVLRPITEGRITTSDQVQAELAQFALDHMNDPLIQEFFGADANIFGDRAQFFATDLLEAGQRVRAKMDQEQKSLQDLDHLIEITLGRAKGGAMTETRGNVDRMVAWSKRRQVEMLVRGSKAAGFNGVILNPAVVGIAGSLGMQGMLRGAGMAGRALDLPSLGVGSALAGIAAGVRARSEYRADRAQSQVHRIAYGQTPEANARKHQELSQYDYQTVSANELLNGGGTDTISGVTRRSFDELLNLDLTLQANRIELFSRMAEIDSRIEYGNINNVDLISYANKNVMEQQRMQFDREIARSRIALRRTGMSDADIDRETAQLRATAEQALIQNVQQQNQRFEAARWRYAAGQAGQAALFGAVFGLASQEGVALASRAAEHIPNDIPIAGGLKNLGFFRQTGSTMAEIPWNAGAHMLGHDEVRTDMNINSLGLNIGKIQELYQHPGNMEFTMPDGSHYTLAVGDNYQASLLDASGNRLPTPPLEISQDGHITSWGPVPDQLKSTLHDTGWTLNEHVTNPDQDLALGVTRWMEAVQNGNADHITGIHGNMIYDLQPDGHMSVTINLTTDNVMVHGIGTMVDGKGIIDVDPTLAGNAEAFANHGELIRHELGAAGFHVETTTIPGKDEMVDINDYLKEHGMLSPTMRQFWHDNQTPMRFVNGHWVGADGKEIQLYHQVVDATAVSREQAFSHLKSQIPPIMLRSPQVQQMMAELQQPGALQKLTPEDVQRLIEQFPPQVQQAPQFQAAVAEFSKIFEPHDRSIEVDFDKMVSYLMNNKWVNPNDHTIDNLYGPIAKDVITLPSGAHQYHNFEVMFTPNKAMDEARQAVIFNSETHPEIVNGKLRFPVDSDEARMFFQFDENGNPIANSFGPNNYQKASFIEVAHHNENGTRDILATSQGSGVEEWQIKTPDHPLFHVTPPSSVELIPPEAPLPGDNPWFITPGRSSRNELERTIPGVEPPPPPVIERYPGLPTYEGNFPPGSRMKDLLRRQNQGRIEPGRIQINDTEGRHALQEAKDAFNQADTIYFVLGGAIGDSVIATAYLRGIQEALRQQGKNTPITIVANQDYGNLFDGLATGNINIIKAPRGAGLSIANNAIRNSSNTSPLIIDFEHYRDENPSIEKDQRTGTTTIKNLLGPSIELYNNNTDGERRYSHAIEELFSLNRDSIPPQEARPLIPLPANKDALYQSVAQRCGVDTTNQNQIGIVVEGSRPGKRYSLDNWTQVISEMSTQRPEYQFNIFYNANNPQPGYGKRDIEQAIQRAGLTNVHLIEGTLEESVSLMDKQKLVLSNDTGFAHIAASLENGPKAVTVFTPKNFPPVFWVSSDRQIPIMIDTAQEAQLPDVDINVDDERQKLINKIPPQQVAQAAINQLP